MREYYIRREGDEDSSGPFDLDQISSLMEAGKLDAEAYFYDIENETWALISSNQEMMDALFPKKEKLNLLTPELAAEKARIAAEEKAAAEAAAKAEAEARGEIPAEDSEASEKKDEKASKKKTKLKKKKEETPERERIDVTEMLAVAEGRAEDPSGRSPREKKAAVAYFGLRFLTLFFLCSAAAMAYIEKDLVMAANIPNMAKSPYLIVAAVDVVISLVLLLQVTAIYPVIRFRAAIGAGLLTVFFYASEDYLLVLGNLLLMLGMYFCSATVKIRFLIASALMGVLGILSYAYVFFLQNAPQ